MPSKSSSGGDLPPDPESSSSSDGRSKTDGHGASAGSGAASSAATGPREVGERRKQFLVAPRQPAATLAPASFGPLAFAAPAYNPLSFDNVKAFLEESKDIDYLHSVGSNNSFDPMSSGMGGDNKGIMVARMSPQVAADLYRQGGGALLVERDQHLYMTDASFRIPQLVSGFLRGGPTIDITITVIGLEDRPVAGAEVSVFGNLLPVSGVTDASGQVVLTLPSETPHTLSGLYVKPKSDYWSFYQRDPDITTDEPNVVKVSALSEWQTMKDFPQRQTFGWGQKAMRLDQLPQDKRGRGIKIAIIDSGAAALTHQNLKQIHSGIDILNNKDTQSWTIDQLGHGSHCSAIVGGAAIATGIRGFAPEAQIHECKLFPGGQVSQLIDALEYCISNQIDIVNLSLGGAQPSEALEQQIVRAKRAGIACIVAAGNSGGPVQYPASSPNVLSVAAIGKLGEFPPSSYHSQTLTGTVDANGYFVAKFSCFGPRVDVCAPGVAIISAVPDDNFAAWDGTSMAAPHITGLAALVLAHHPDFQASFGVRGPERVERLFQIIKASARMVSVSDSSHVGAGLPDTLVAVGLQPGLAQQAAAASQASQAIGGIAGNGASIQMPGNASIPAAMQFAQRFPPGGIPPSALLGNPFGGAGVYW